MVVGGALVAAANCAITALPSPTAKSSQFYRWFFNVSHAAVLAVWRIWNQYKKTAVANRAPRA